MSLATEQALYTGDLSLVRQRYEDLKKHSFTYWFDKSVGLVVKPPALMGAAGCKCPAFGARPPESPGTRDVCVG